MEYTAEMAEKSKHVKQNVNKMCKVPGNVAANKRHVPHGGQGWNVLHIVLYNALQDTVRRGETRRALTLGTKNLTLQAYLLQHEDHEVRHAQGEFTRLDGGRHVANRPQGLVFQRHGRRRCDDDVQQLRQGAASEQVVNVTRFTAGDVRETPGGFRLQRGGVHAGQEADQGGNNHARLDDHVQRWILICMHTRTTKNLGMANVQELNCTKGCTSS